MTLQALKGVLDGYFGPPFLPEGHVRTEWRHEGRELAIYIGRRDVQIGEDGSVSGCGTIVCEEPQHPTDSP